MVSFRQAATGTKTALDGQNLVIPVPAGVVDGDALVFFAFGVGAANTPGLPAGLTNLDTEATGPSVRSCYRVASSEPASYTFTVIDANGACGACAAYRGASGTPVNQHSAWHRAVGSTTITADSVTTDADGCLLVWLGGYLAANTLTVPTGYVERAAAVGGTGHVKIADATQLARGATGAVTGTLDVGVNNQGSLIAITPTLFQSPTRIAVAGGGVL